VFSSDDEDWAVRRSSSNVNNNRQEESSRPPLTLRPPPPPPPPRAQFSLPTPEFSPIFDPLSDREDLNHHHHHPPPPPPPPQPDLNSSSSRNRSRSSLTDLNPLRSSAISDERDRRSHSNFSRPTSSSAHVVPPPPPPPPESPSMYGNFDLNAYHDGPFRASLQRFIELDRVRSRLNRLDNAAANDSATGPGPSLPPSLPPLQFDYDVLPFGHSHSESGSVSLSFGNRKQKTAEFYPFRLRRSHHHQDRIL
jgi:hypothetical protein